MRKPTVVTAKGWAILSNRNRVVCFLDGRLAIYDTRAEARAARSSAEKSPDFGCVHYQRNR